MITYDLLHLIWAGVLIFKLRLKSRRQLKKESETDVFLANLLALSGTSEENVAIPDTLNYLMESLNSVLPISAYGIILVFLFTIKRQPLRVNFDVLNRHYSI